MYGNRYSGADWKARLELAAAYRLVHHVGWIDLIFNLTKNPAPEVRQHRLKVLGRSGLGAHRQSIANQGSQGLEERSRRPHTSPNQTASQVIEALL